MSKFAVIGATLALLASMSIASAPLHEGRGPV
jgi:hypothetical protein